MIDIIWEAFSIAGAGQKSSETFITKVYKVGNKLLPQLLCKWLHEVIHSKWPDPVPPEVINGGFVLVPISWKVAHGGLSQSFHSMQYAVVADMDANDTASVVFNQSDGTASSAHADLTDDNMRTNFHGYFLG